MKKKKKKNKAFSNFEKFYIVSISLIIICLIIGIVFGQTTLAQINLDVQKLSRKVDDQRNVNKSLEMKIDEMTSLDRIKMVSEKYGLSYNSDNLKTIK